MEKLIDIGELIGLVAALVILPFLGTAVFFLGGAVVSGVVLLLAGALVCVIGGVVATLVEALLKLMVVLGALVVNGAVAALGGSPPISISSSQTDLFLDD